MLKNDKKQNFDENRLWRTNGSSDGHKGSM